MHPVSTHRACDIGYSRNKSENPIREKPYEIVYICTCVFLIYDILEYVYHSACDNKFSVQLDPYLACQFAAQSSHVVTCVQIFYA